MSLKLNLTTALLLCNAALLFAQPVLIKDLNNGTPDGFDEFNYAGVHLNDAYLMPANDGQSGEELYLLKNNTLSLLKDINPGSGGGDPTQFIVLNGATYFKAKGADGIFTLWKSDGTASGTQQVAATAAWSVNYLIADKNNVIYFDSNGDLYYYNPGTGDAAKVEGLPYLSLEPDYSSIGAVACPFQNGIVIAVAGSSELDFWKVEGANASKLYSQASPGFFTDVYGLIPLGDGFLFIIDNSVYPTDDGLYFYLPNNGSATRIVNASDDPYKLPRRIKPFNAEKVIFMDGQNIFVTNGTSAGTVKIHNNVPSLYQGKAWNTAFHNGKMLFEAEESVFSVKIMVTNGTATGTKVVATTNDPFISPMVNYEGHVWWASGTSNLFKPTIWHTDLLSETSDKVYSYTGSSPINSVIPIALDQNKLYLLSNMGGVGRELYSLNVPQNTAVTALEGLQKAYQLKFVQGGFMVEQRDAAPEEVNLILYSADGRMVMQSRIRCGTLTPLPSLLKANVYYFFVSGKDGNVVTAFSGH